MPMLLMLIPLLALLALLGVALALGRAGAAAPAGGVRRGRLWRSAWPALGFIILAGIGIGTWRSAFAPIPPPATADQLRLPTLPAPRPQAAGPLSGARVLVEAVIFQRDHALRADEFEVLLPRDHGVAFERSGLIGGVHFTVRATIDAVTAITKPDGLSVQASGELVEAVHHFGGSSEASTSPDLGPAHELISISNGGGGLWTLINGNGNRLRMVARLQLVDPADPLRAVSAAEFAQALDRDVAASPASRTGKHTNLSPPGLAYVSIGGPAVLLAILAALLLAQAFHRRTLAFAGCLGLCMLYCAGLDRLVVDRAAAQAGDAALSADQRARALDALAGTFFNRHAGGLVATRLADDSAAPQEVRDAAAAACAQLDWTVANEAEQRPSRARSDF